MTVRTTSGQRWWAAAAIVLAVAALALAAAAAIAHFPSGLAVLLCCLVGLGAAWFGILRRGALRVAALAVGALFLGGAVVLVVVEKSLLEDILVVVAVFASLTAARLAFRIHVELPRVERPLHPVLFYNPKSGGGKAERFHLADEARRRGIEPIELQLGEDLETLVRGAVGPGRRRAGNGRRRRLPGDRGQGGG